jgi:predicted component of type VI protein secretion system
MKNTSIKQIHLAKLRVLREEIQRDIRDNTRRVEARRRAEQCELSWELVKLGVKPIRQGRLFK